MSPAATLSQVTTKASTRCSAFGTVAERSGGTFRVTVHDVAANDEHAVGLHLSEGERAGRRLHSQQTLVFHVRDGMVAETWAHHYDQHATDEFWA
jgi:ketosteroid isomerase-like protein